MKFSELVRDVLVPVENEAQKARQRIVKSSSYNAGLNQQIAVEDLDNMNFAILKSIQKK
jgi:hypothetical protein